MYVDTQQKKQQQRDNEADELAGPGPSTSITDTTTSIPLLTIYISVRATSVGAALAAGSAFGIGCLQQCDSQDAVPDQQCQQQQQPRQIQMPPLGVTLMEGAGAIRIRPSSSSSSPSSSTFEAIDPIAACGGHIYVTVHDTFPSLRSSSSSSVSVCGKCTENTVVIIVPPSSISSASSTQQQQQPPTTISSRVAAPAVGLNRTGVRDIADGNRVSSEMALRHLYALWPGLPSSIAEVVASKIFASLFKNDRRTNTSSFSTTGPTTGLLITGVPFSGVSRLAKAVAQSVTKTIEHQEPKPTATQSVVRKAKPLPPRTVGIDVGQLLLSVGTPSATPEGDSQFAVGHAAAVVNAALQPTLPPLPLPPLPTAPPLDAIVVLEGLHMLGTVDHSLGEDAGGAPSLAARLVTAELLRYHREWNKLGLRVLVIGTATIPSISSTHQNKSASSAPAGEKNSSSPFTSSSSPVGSGNSGSSGSGTGLVPSPLWVDPEALVGTACVTTPVAPAIPQRLAVVHSVLHRRHQIRGDPQKQKQKRSSQQHLVMNDAASFTDEADVERIVELTEGLTVGECVKVCHEFIAMKMVKPEEKEEVEVEEEEEVQHAATAIQQQKQQEHRQHQQKQRELFGIDAALRIIERALLKPLKHFHLLRRANIPLPRGLLVTGPTGSGKTAFLSAIAVAIETMNRKNRLVGSSKFPSSLNQHHESSDERKKKKKKTEKNSDNKNPGKERKTKTDPVAGSSSSSRLLSLQQKLLFKQENRPIGVSMLHVDAHTLLTKEVGQSEKNVANLFQQARTLSPCCIFLDGIDALCPPRGRNASEGNASSDRVLSTFLTEMDGIAQTQSQSQPLSSSSYEGSAPPAHSYTPTVVVVASAMSQDSIDAALRRPGRLDLHIPLGLPTEDVFFEALSRRFLPLVEEDIGGVMGEDEEGRGDKEEERAGGRVGDHKGDPAQAPVAVFAICMKRLARYLHHRQSTFADIEDAVRRVALAVFQQHEHVQPSPLSSHEQDHGDGESEDTKATCGAVEQETATNTGDQEEDEVEEEFAFGCTARFLSDTIHKVFSLPPPTNDYGR